MPLFMAIDGYRGVMVCFLTIHWQIRHEARALEKIMKVVPSRF